MVIRSSLTGKSYFFINVHLAFRRKFFYAASIAVLIAFVTSLIFSDYWGLLFLAAYVVMVGANLLSILNGVRSGQNANLFVNCRRQFTKEGVETETPTSASKVSWSTFSRWRRLAGHYLLFTHSNSFVAVPEQAVPNVSHFENILKANITLK